jgi:uncharacterized protein YutD
MEIKIEDYRGFEITFDTDDETFRAVNDNYDTERKKKTYSSVKKDIDDYIKANADFKPFLIQQKIKHGRIKSSNFDPIRVVGLRKDGRFMIERNGKVEQLSDYDIRDYCVYNPQNDILKAEYLALREQERDIDAKILAMGERFVPGKLLVQVKAEMMIN